MKKIFIILVLLVIAPSSAFSNDRLTSVTNIDAMFDLVSIAGFEVETYGFKSLGFNLNLDGSRTEKVVIECFGRSLTGIADLLKAEVTIGTPEQQKAYNAWYEDSESELQGCYDLAKRYIL